MARPKAGYELDGVPIPGTTTITGLLNKPALVGWAGKTCTQFAWEAGKAGQPLPRWTDVLYGKRDDAASAGTLVHELFESWLRNQGALPPVPEGDVGKAAWQGFENAVRWLEGSALQIEPHERPLISRQYRYGGTPDALARDRDGRVYLADWKTSAGVYPEMIVQMSAYRHLLRECEGIEVAGLHLVRFSREHADFGHYAFGIDILDIGWEVFEALLALYRPLKQLEQRVK